MGGTLSLAAAAGETLGGLRLACEALRPLLDAEPAGGTASSLVAGLGSSRAQLRQAADRLRAAEASLRTVDQTALDEATRSFAVTLSDRLPGIAARLALLAELPALLGVDGPRSYLVLGQNSDELRPTGGFIGTAGLLTFDRGGLVWRDFGSSFELRLPPDLQVDPPLPLQRYMGAAYWQLYEANWWPDFPSSARQAAYFYRQLRPEPLAGVVAIDQSFVALLLEVTGPIEVPEYAEVVTSTNLRERLEHNVHLAPSRTERERKGFVSTLFTHLVGRLEHLPPERFGALVTALDRGLVGQNILVWTEDERAQRAIASLGWDGRLLATTGDFLYPVSANVSGDGLGGFKINRAVDQALTYRVEQGSEGRLLGRAALTLRNRAQADPSAGRSASYRNYLRLYVPAGSELLDARGFEGEATTLSECGRTVIAGLVLVEPGAEQRIEVSYHLPASIQPAGYSLLVQKQPGAAPFTLEVEGSGPLVGAHRVKAAGHQLFRSTGGQLGPERWAPASWMVTDGAACALNAEPPRVLTPPSELEIPRLELRVPTVELGVQPDGMLEAPASGDVVGWYVQTARPGQVGNFIAAGHLDWERQPAVFWRLRELEPGDRMSVLATDGARHEYEVEWVRSVDTYDAPLGEILGATTERWMTLITCGGSFDPHTRDYSERVIVRATLRNTL